MKAYCSNVLYCTTLSGVREKGHMGVQRTRGQAVCLSIWRKCNENPVKWLSVGNYATLLQYFEWDWSTLCMFAVLPRDRFGLRRHCVTTTDENLKCDIPIQRHVVAICKVLIVGYDICHIRSSSTCSQTVSSCCSNTNGSLKKRALRHGRAWKMKIRAWKNQDPCFHFYKHIYALLHKYPV